MSSDADALTVKRSLGLYITEGDIPKSDADEWRLPVIAVPIETWNSQRSSVSEAILEISSSLCIGREEAGNGATVMSPDEETMLSFCADATCTIATAISSKYMFLKYRIVHIVFTITDKGSKYSVVGRKNFSDFVLGKKSPESIFNDRDLYNFNSETFLIERASVIF